jgi:hypothetical protein
MKKLIYTIGALMFLSGPVYPWSINAAEPSSSDIACEGMTLPQLCQLSSRVKYALRGKDNQGLDFGASFGESDPKKVGQDLYLTIYKKTVTSPFEDAIKATAAQYGLPVERMSLILGGDIRPILERNPLLRIEDATRIYNQMIATFNDKKNTLDLNAKITAKVEMNEIFADGDTENSGFDLINDLANIEIILFKKNDPVTFGEGYSPADDQENQEQDPAKTNEQDSQAAKDLPIDISGLGDAVNQSESEKAGIKTGKNPFDQLDQVGLKNNFLGGINPNQCFASDNLDKALNKFSDEASKNNKLKNTNPEKKPADKVENDMGNGNDSGSLPDVDLVGSTGNSTKSTTAPKVKSAEPGNYDQPAICDEVVCISLDFIKTQAKPSFSQTDNCILCHVQFINESLKKTISHSLIPAKATGNLGESGLCKNAAGTALGAVGMNISLKTVPVVTPAKDDLMTLTNVGDEWDRYAKDNGFWNYSEKKRQVLQAKQNGGTPTYTPSISAIERQLMVEIQSASEKATQQSVLAKAEEAYGKTVAGEKYEILKAEIAKEAFGQASTLQALNDEMRKMNSYFSSFQKMFKTLLEDVPGMPGTKACVKLNQKQQCS